jgi:hypothetical protein
MQLEMAVLQYLHDEIACSAFEIAEFVRLNDAEPSRAEELLDEWRARGWVEELEQDDDLPTLIRLTQQAYRDQPWLPQPPNEEL